MSRYDPKQHLKDLVKKANITQIILVDDDFDAEVDKDATEVEAVANFLEVNRDDKEKINKVKQLKLDQYGISLFNINGELQELDALDKRLLQHWVDIPEEEKEQLFEILHIENTIELTQQAVGSLFEMLEETIEVKKRGVQQWLQEQEKPVDNHSATKEYVLVLFDLNLKNINTRAEGFGRSDKAGYWLVKKVLDSGDSHIIPGIMTNEVQDKQQELELSEEQFGMGITAAVIMKNRLQEPQAMVEGLEMMVSAHALYEMGTAVQDAFKLVAREESWGNVELPALLKMAKSAEEEGCHASESLLRLMQSRSSDKLSFKVRHTCMHNSSIKLLDNFGDEWYKVFLNSNEVLDKTDNMPLSYQDSYISGQDLATHRMPTYLGDIYKVSDPTAGSDCYILLHQPCNISVRNNGKRKAGEQGLVLAKLIEYKKDTKRISQSTISLPIPFKMENNASDPPSGQSSRFYCVDFLDYFHLPPWLLDLCVYNDDGKAKTFEEDKLSNGPLEYGWLQRGNTMFKIVEGKSKKYKELVKKGKLKENDEITKLLRLAVFGLSELKWDITYDNGYYDFGFQRIARLRSNIAEGILTEFARYQSRAAYPSQLL
mgnify:FL=1